MKILLNNREEEFDKKCITVGELIILKQLSFKMRLVRINGSLIQKDLYDNTYINNDDNVQILYLMSGG